MQAGSLRTGRLFRLFRNPSSIPVRIDSDDELAGSLIVICTVDETCSAETYFAAVLKFRLLDPFTIDISAVAAAQIVKGVMVVFSYDTRMAFGDGWMFDDKSVIERAADKGLTFVENVGNALLAIGFKTDEMRAGIEVFFGRQFGVCATSGTEFRARALRI